ncbi:hypothetical protein FNF29_06375 [Cafeteria roenbergensis]|uniref:cGMP-dependent protein kinase n=1 Tax=Cafeteria roenbergensis TaxID=33653 RepID=A0A5A8CAL9_CAFRO|nr:hypothetical protein FNF29_06375 [Cafeteria roenbergensis]|eukprot:KAA0148901.1 hypothetical protein FNF29_06375 [Cafeteria roenbergensis]
MGCGPSKVPVGPSGSDKAARNDGGPASSAQSPSPSKQPKSAQPPHARKPTPEGHAGGSAQVAPTVVAVAPSPTASPAPAASGSGASRAAAAPTVSAGDGIPLVDTESEALAFAAEGQQALQPTGVPASVSVTSGTAPAVGISSASDASPSPVTNQKMLKAASSFWQLTAQSHEDPRSSPDLRRRQAGSSPSAGAGKDEPPADEWVTEAMAARSAALGADVTAGRGGMRERSKKRRGSVLPETLEGGDGRAAKGDPDAAEGGDAGGATASGDAPLASARSDRSDAGPAVPKSPEELAMVLGSMGKSFLFRGLGRSERTAIAEAMGSSACGPGDEVAREGAPASTFFVVRSGTVVVLVSGKPVGRIGAGGHFGELQLLFQTPAQATVRAETECSFFAVGRRDFRRALAGAAERTKEENIAFLRGVPLLRGVEQRILTSLAEALQTIEFEAGHAIMRQGSVGSVFYIVQSGECSVVKRSAGPMGEVEEVEVLRLKEGAFFGEQALLHDKPRAATVLTVSATTVLALSKDDFVKVFGPAEQLAAAMERTHSQRQEMEVAARSRSRAAMKDRQRNSSVKDDLTAGGLGAVAVEELGSDEEDDPDEVARREQRRADREGPTAAVSNGSGPGAAAQASVAGPASGSYRVSSGGGLKSKPSRLDMPIGVDDGEDETRRRIMAKGRDAAASRSTAVIATSASGAGASIAAGSEGVAGPSGASEVASAKPHVRKIPSSAVLSGTGSRAAPGAQAPASAAGGSAGRSTASSRSGAKGGTTGDDASVTVKTAQSPTTTAAMAASGLAAGGLAATSSFRTTRPELQLDALQVRAVLGEGAFGRVMLVQERTSGEVFALKQMSKARIVKTGQKKNVLNEKSIMMRLEHPHVIQLIKTFQDRDCLYMLIEFAQGGDLFGLLGRVGGMLTGKLARYYASVVASVFAYMHGMSIVYRDLKPENLCLMDTGMLKVVDFGFAKVVKPGDRTYTLCGTPEYLAPELISGLGHREGVDWWALGILIFEMLHGYSPFSDPDSSDHRVIYRNIIKGRMEWHDTIASERAARSLVRKLLESNPARRLGSLRRGSKDVLEHRFFSSVDWAAVRSGTVPPPLRPKVKSRLDVSAFDEVEVKRNKIDPYVSDGTNWDASF